jgi:hypothetical protein
MGTTSLLAVCFLTLWPTHTASSLRGVWALNIATSDFGRSNAPEQLVTRIEQGGSHLAIWTITIDTEGRHLAHREYDLNRKAGALNEVVSAAPRRIVFRINSVDGSRIDEEWQIAKSGELIINRVVTASIQVVRQRLVMEPTTAMAERGSN